MGHAIFISYRRDDTEGEAGRLFDDLSRAFGDSCVFMDVAGISPGVDFRKAIEDNVVSCGVLLAVIGPAWVSISNPDGHRRLEDPNDFVRLEISSALKRNVAVIPVLVHDAKMPHPEALPEDLKDFCFRNSVELSHARWNSDVALLINALKSYVKTTPASEQETVHATVSVQLPAPRPAEEPAAPKKTVAPWMQGAAVAAVLVIAGVAYFAMRSKPSAPAPDLLVAAAPASGGAASGASAPLPASPEPGGGQQFSEDQFMGRWALPNRTPGNNLGTLEITGSGSALTMQGWGACQPNICDWGTQPARFNGRTVTATFFVPSELEPTGESRVATVEVAPGLNGLDVLVRNTFAKEGQTRKNQIYLHFARSK